MQKHFQFQPLKCEDLLERLGFSPMSTFTFVLILEYDYLSNIFLYFLYFPSILQCGINTLS